jgi:hypothetical protein
MPLRVIQVENVTTDEDWEDHHTLFAYRVEGDYYLDQKSGSKSEPFEYRAWHIQDSSLVVYREELDGYIELFQKIKAAAEQ